MAIERRQHARQKLYQPEYFDMGAENGGVVVDLSEDGLGFQAVDRVEKGRNVTLSFSLGSGYRIAARARIAWVGPGGNSGGTTFTALPPDSRSIIREWLTKAAAERVGTHEAHDNAPAADPETIADEGERVSLLPPIIERVETPRAPLSVPPPPVARPSEPPAAPAPVSEPVAQLPEDSSPATPQQAREEPNDNPPDSPPPVALPPEIRAEAAEKKTEPAEAPAQTEVENVRAAALPPTFPPRNTGELFSRSPWISGQAFPEEKRSHKSLIAVIVICVLIIAAIASVPYLRSHRQQIGDAIVRAGRSVAGEPAPSAAAQPQTPPQPSPQPSAPLSATSSPATGTAPANPRAAVAKPLESPAPAATPPASASLPPAGRHPAALSANPGTAAASPASRGATPLAATSPTASPLDTGQTEFQRAQQYLNGTGVAADPAEAAQWFWRSLEKGNSRAAIPLADLYLKGQGVSRSCLQARILLTAAARKGNADAAQKLSELPENCE